MGTHGFPFARCHVIKKASSAAAKATVQFVSTPTEVGHAPKRVSILAFTWGILVSRTVPRSRLPSWNPVVMIIGYRMPYTIAVDSVYTSTRPSYVVVRPVIVGIVYILSSCRPVMEGTVFVS